MIRSWPNFLAMSAIHNTTWFRSVDDRLRATTIIILVALYAAIAAPAHARPSESAAGVSAHRMLVAAGKFSEVYDPSVGETNRWALNDHTIIFGPDKLWHVFAITHPIPLNWYEDPGRNLLHATATNLTQAPWHKAPFAVTANWDTFGEFLLWAPQIIRHKNLFYMFVCVG